MFCHTGEQTGGEMGGQSNAHLSSSLIFGCNMDAAFIQGLQNFQGKEMSPS